MSAPILDVADRVTAYLNDATWQSGLGAGNTFAAKRAYLPQKSLIDVAAGGLTVLVIPATEDTGLASRGRTLDDRSVYINVIKKLALGSDDSFNQAEIDGVLTGVVEPIKERLKFTRLSDYGWIGQTHKPIYDPAHLEQYRQLSSLLTVTYRGTTA